MIDPKLGEYLRSLDTDDDTVGSCRALDVYNGGPSGEKWTGHFCDCKHIQGNLNCKLNPF